MLSQVKSRGIKQPQYYAPIDKKMVDNGEIPFNCLVRVEKVNEVFETDFAWFIGKEISVLKDIAIHDWYPLVDHFGEIENFITADFESLWRPTKHFNRDDYDYDKNRDCAIYKSK